MRPPERPCLLQEVIHHAGRRLVLHFEVADAARQVPRSLLLAPNLEYAVTENQQAFRWVNATELRNLQFPPANRGILELLIERALQSLP